MTDTPDPRIEVDLNHTPLPGPGYWDWRCTRCDARVDAHPGLIRRLLNRYDRRTS